MFFPAPTALALPDSRLFSKPCCTQPSLTVTFSATIPDSKWPPADGCTSPAYRGSPRGDLSPPSGSGRPHVARTCREPTTHLLTSDPLDGSAPASLPEPLRAGSGEQVISGPPPVPCSFWDKVGIRGAAFSTADFYTVKGKLSGESGYQRLDVKG